MFRYSFDQSILIAEIILNYFAGQTFPLKLKFSLAMFQEVWVLGFLICLKGYNLRGEVTRRHNAFRSPAGKPK